MTGNVQQPATYFRGSRSGCKKPKSPTKSYSLCVTITQCNGTVRQTEKFPRFPRPLCRSAKHSAPMSIPSLIDIRSSPHFPAGWLRTKHPHLSHKQNSRATDPGKDGTPITYLCLSASGRQRDAFNGRPMTCSACNGAYMYVIQS